MVPSSTPSLLVGSFEACKACQQAHAACNNHRPCSRCVELGYANECRSAPVVARRKRGRPRKIDQQHHKVSFVTKVAQPKKLKPTVKGTLFARLQTQALYNSTPIAPTTSSSVQLHQRPDSAELPPQLLPYIDALPMRSSSPEQSHHFPTEGNLQEDLNHATMSDTVLTLLVNEVRDLKGMRKEIQELTEITNRAQLERDALMKHITTMKLEQQRAEQQLHSLQQNLQEQDRLNKYLLERLNRTSPKQATPSQLPLSIPRGNDSNIDILRRLPFLSGYDIANPANNFILADTSKPFAALVAVKPELAINQTWEIASRHPPLFIFANDAFCDLLAYPLHELLGTPITALFKPEPHLINQIIPLVTQRSRVPMSKPVRDGTWYTDREGRQTRLIMQTQFYYDTMGLHRWVLLCVEGMENAGAHTNTTPYADNHHTRHTIRGYNATTTTTNLSGPGSHMLEVPTCQGSRDGLVEPSSGPGEAQVSQQLEGLELDDVASFLVPPMNTDYWFGE